MSKEPSNDPFDEPSSIHIAQMMLTADDGDKFGGRSDSFSQFLTVYHRHGFIIGAVNYQRRFCHAARKFERIGRLMVLSVQNQDYTLTQALVMFVVTVAVLSNLVVDLLYAWLDPRIRLA